MDELKHVKLVKRDGISWIYLNRPEKKNAMNPRLHEEMDSTLARLETDPDTKVVVIAGAGGNFSAGQDLKEFFRDNEENPAAFKRAAEHANRWRWERLYGYESPAVLRATKQAVRHVRTMDFGQAYDYLREKGQAIKVRDPEQSYKTGLSQFIDQKSYKPVYSPFKLGTMLTDQRK